MALGRRQGCGKLGEEGKCDMAEEPLEPVESDEYSLAPETKPAPEAPKSSAFDAAPIRQRPVIENIPPGAFGLCRRPAHPGRAKRGKAHPSAGHRHCSRPVDLPAKAQEPESFRKGPGERSHQFSNHHADRVDCRHPDRDHHELPGGSNSHGHHSCQRRFQHYRGHPGQQRGQCLSVSLFD